VLVTFSPGLSDLPKFMTGVLKNEERGEGDRNGDLPNFINVDLDNGIGVRGRELWHCRPLQHQPDVHI